MSSEVVTSEYSFEVALDPEPAPTRGPVYVDVVARDDDRRPILPAAWRPGNIKGTLRWYAGRTAHRIAYHTVRLPRYVLLAVFWAVVGLARIIGRQIAWWWVLEQHALRQHTASQNDYYGWQKLHREAKRTRLFRGMVLAVEVATLAGLVAILALWAPRWVAVAVAAAAVPFLAHYGRPATSPIVTPAVVTPRFRKLTADIVLRAYYAAGLGHPDKEGQQVTFGSVMARDGEGSRVVVDLPYGRGFEDAVRARAAIASGLDVATSQVFLHRDPTSTRRHVLWVADRDPLAIPAGRTPLLAGRPTDIWQPAPFGLDERGRPVNVPLLWNSILVGAQPRQGKTFSARALALYAAMDPYVKLTVFDGKGSPDWRKFSLVADRYGFGLAMSREGNPVENLLETLRELRRDVEWRYQRLSELPVSICPEGKLTREIARDPKYNMPVRLVVIDEFQEYFDLGEASKEIASLLVYLVKVAPAAGVTVLGCTQRPSGIGNGQVQQQFTSFRDNFQVRFSLRTGSWQMSDLVLGAGAYSEGYDSSTLLPTYKGVGILRGASDDTPTVRTYLADGQDAERILTVARDLRKRAGTLSGMAAGEDMSRPARDVLADVIRVFSQAGRRALQWEQLAELLAAEHPETYAGETPDSISALIRAEGVPSESVKADGQVRRGCKREAVEAAIRRREITAG